MVTLRGYFIYFELRVFLQSNGTILNIEYLKEGFLKFCSSTNAYDRRLSMASWWKAFLT